MHVVVFCLGIFFKISFFKKYIISGIASVSDKTWHFVGPDLG